MMRKKKRKMRNSWGSRARIRWRLLHGFPWSCHAACWPTHGFFTAHTGIAYSETHRIYAPGKKPGDRVAFVSPWQRGDIPPRATPCRQIQTCNSFALRTLCSLPPLSLNYGLRHCCALCTPSRPPLPFATLRRGVWKETLFPRRRRECNSARHRRERERERESVSLLVTSRLLWKRCTWLSGGGWGSHNTSSDIKCLSSSRGPWSVKRSLNKKAKKKTNASRTSLINFLRSQ